MAIKQLFGTKLATELGRKIDFEFFAPQATSVFLAGTFNDWDVQSCALRKARDGKWRTTLSLVPGRYEYRFLVDNVWECDQNAPECAPNPFGSWNSILNVQ
ncbi:MAG: isoamylase early set domain-containing protein [Candidatus Omnitrophica bacterium]|nr:isoamylase early set domain-containing protein [Candidatus Omnitrophota bacterium]